MAWTQIHQTQYKLAWYYANPLYDLDTKFQQGGAQAPVVLAQFETERPMMLHCIDFCSGLVSHNRHAAEMYLSFVLAGSDLFKLQLSPSERIAIRQKALKVARIQRFPTKLGRLLTLISNDYTDTGEYDKAIKYSEEALRIAPTTDDPEVERLARAALAYTYVQLGKPEEAQPHLAELAHSHDVLTNARNASSFHQEMGNTSVLNGDYSKALEHYQRGFDIAEQQGNVTNQIQSLYGMAMVHAHLKNYKSALSYAEQARTISHSLGDRRNESMALGQMARIYIDKGQYSRAIHYGKSSIELKETEDKLGLAYEYNNLGQAYTLAGNRVKALENLAQARVLFVELKNEAWIQTVDEAIQFNQSSRGLARSAVMKLRYWNIK